jgi:CTP:molybdopterin cytidylyltransferase MocA
VQPVDCPIVLPATFLALAAAMEDAEVAIPSYRGRHGHPPLLSAAVIPRILAAGPDEPLSGLLQARVQGSGFRVQNSGFRAAGGLARGSLLPNPSYGVGCRFVEVDDPGVLVNIDRREDLEQLAGILGGRREAEGEVEE